MTSDDIMTSQQVAELLSLTDHTVRVWRTQGEGPKWFKVGTKAIRYHRADVEAWINEQRQAAR